MEGRETTLVCLCLYNQPQLIVCFASAEVYSLGEHLEAG